MFIFLVILACVLFGLLTLLGIAAAHAAERDADRRGTSRWLFVLGAVMLGFSAGVIGLGVFVTLTRGTHAEALLVVFLLAMLLLAPAGALLIVLSLDLTGRRLRSRWLISGALRRMLTIAGYLLCCGPLVVVFPPLGGLAVAVLVVSLAQFQQSRQTNLLWLLTIAVERGLPLPEELRASAAAVEGNSAEQLRRLADAVEAGESLGEALVRQPALFLVPPRWRLLSASRRGVWPDHSGRRRSAPAAMRPMPVVTPLSPGS